MTCCFLLPACQEDGAPARRGAVWCTAAQPCSLPFPRTPPSLAPPFIQPEHLSVSQDSTGSRHWGAAWIFPLGSLLPSQGRYQCFLLNSRGNRGMKSLLVSPVSCLHITFLLLSYIPISWNPPLTSRPPRMAAPTPRPDLLGLHGSCCYGTDLWPLTSTALIPICGFLSDPSALPRSKG